MAKATKATKAKAKTRPQGGTGAAKKANRAKTRGTRTPSRVSTTRKGGAHATAGSRRKDTRRPNDVLSTAERNEYDDTQHNHATYALEAADPSVRPSRKSTRRASNRAKPDANLHRRQTRRVRSPASRSQMRGA